MDINMKEFLEGNFDNAYIGKKEDTQEFLIHYTDELGKAVTQELPLLDEGWIKGKEISLKHPEDSAHNLKLPVDYLPNIIMEMEDTDKVVGIMKDELLKYTIVLKKSGNYYWAFRVDVKD